MSAASIADQFQSSLASGDADGLRAVVSDDVSFDGPVTQTSGADETVRGLVEMAKMTQSTQVDCLLADDANALVWSTLTTQAGTQPAATWLTIDGDQITGIKTVFNAR